jgi:hypothetical protein
MLLQDLTLVHPILAIRPPAEFAASGRIASISRT